MSESLTTYHAGAIKPAEHYTLATDVAGLCREIVSATAQNIQGRKYVRVEGWQAIATAHGCIASARDVEPIAGGLRCIGEVRRIDTGAVIATAEGFVGDDEKTWASRPVYARRAMVQTRAISRACRSAFAHVVVMMNAGLETTPAEEVPAEGFEHAKPVNISHAQPATPTSPEQVKVLCAEAKKHGIEPAELATRVAKVHPYIVGQDKVLHLTWLKLPDYNDVSAWVAKGCKADAPAEDQIPMGDSAEPTPAPATPAGTTPLPREFWPEAEFPEGYTIIIACVNEVKDPEKSAKSGKFGPYKVTVQQDAQSEPIEASTFSKTLAELCRSMIGEALHEVALVTVQNGRFTNHNLHGIR